MNFFDIMLTGVGVAMDAFAVSICKGLSMKKLDFKKMLLIGFYFGFFQALMPLIGYLLGSSFEKFIISIDHWIVFVLLLLIGINMIREALFEKEEKLNDSVSFKVMLPLAISTSIDALAIGISYAFLKVNIIVAILVIGIITFSISAMGVKIGNKFGNKYEIKAQVVGGIILVLIGTKILFEHLGFNILSFFCIM